MWWCMQTRSDDENRFGFCDSVLTAVQVLYYYFFIVTGE